MSTPVCNGLSCADNFTILITSGLYSPQLEALAGTHLVAFEMCASLGPRYVKEVKNSLNQTIGWIYLRPANMGSWEVVAAVDDDIAAWWTNTTDPAVAACPALGNYPNKNVYTGTSLASVS